MSELCASSAAAVLTEAVQDAVSTSLSDESRAELDRDYNSAQCSDEAATRRLEKVADAGNELALAYLGHLYFKGTQYVTKNEVQSHLYLRQVWTWVEAEVAKGDPFALFIVGNCLLRGLVVEADATKAVRMLSVAASKGHAGSQCNLGWCLQNAVGVPENHTEAVRLFKYAADQGHAKAQCNLGWCYLTGCGTTVNVTEAVRYNKLAADQGLSDAQYNMGIFYMDGTGVDKDEAEAVRYFKLAADQRQTEIGRAHV